MKHNPLEGERADLVFDIEQQSNEEQVSIIVVHRDCSDPSAGESPPAAYLNICLQSIAVASMNNNYEIIVVDNGSTSQDAIDFLDELEEGGECKVIRNSENLWWSKAANQGVKIANKNSKYFVFMHFDTVVLNPTWIDLLINVAESQGAGLVGLSMPSYYIDNQKIDFIEEWCMLVSKECWKDCGPFNEELPLIGAPFIFTMAAQHAGHKPQVIKNSLVHHYRVFSVDVSEYERKSEEAMLVIPNLIKDLQLKYQK